MGEVTIEAELHKVDGDSNGAVEDGAPASSRKGVGRLVRRSALLLICLVVAWIGGAIYLRSTAPVLETSSTVYVRALGQTQDGAAAPDGILSVQPSVMRSAPVASVAILSPGVRDLGILKGENDPVGFIESRLAVRAQADPGVFTLTFTSSDPEDANKLLDAIVASYVSYETIEQRQSMDKLEADLRSQREKTESDLAAAKQRLSDALKNQADSAPTIQTLRDLAQQRGGAAAALADARQGADDARGAYQKAAEAMGGEDKLKQSASDPANKDAAAVVNRYQGALAEVDQVQKRFDALEKQTEDIDSVDDETSNLQRQSQELISLDAELSDRLNHWDRAQETQVAISVLKPAEANRTPIWPKFWPVMGIATLVGVLLSVGVSRGADWMRVRLQNAEDAARFAGAPILGRLQPMPWELTSATLRGQCVLLKPSDPSAIVLEEARISLEKVMAPNFYKTVLVTSLATGQGKSLLATNLAISMAESGLRTVLMDTNYARPAVNEIFGIDDQVGLSDAIEGRMDVHDALHVTELEQLQVLPVGRADANWPDLLNDPELEVVLSNLMERFDRIVIDANCATMNECLCVSAFCDATVLLVDPQRNKRRNLRFAADRLRTVGARVVGIVLNDPPKVRKAQVRTPVYHVGDLRTALVGPVPANRDMPVPGSMVTANPVAPIDDDDEVADGVKQPMRPDAEVDESIDVWGLKLQ
jgi:capsular exopolysaccharide synthesis family protein